MTEQNRSMEQDVSSIKLLLMSKTTQVVDLPGVSQLDDYDMRNTFSDMFMDAAQLHNNWLAIGLESWTQAGSWWLFKAQTNLRDEIPRGKVSAQTYTDLLKAAWIIVDVIPAHPQKVHLRPGSQARKLRNLSEDVKSTLELLKTQNVQLPDRIRLQESRKNIWSEENIVFIAPLVRETSQTRLKAAPSQQEEVFYEV